MEINNFLDVRFLPPNVHFFWRFYKADDSRPAGDCAGSLPLPQVPRLIVALLGVAGGESRVTNLGIHVKEMLNALAPLMKNHLSDLHNSLRSLVVFLCKKGRPAGAGTDGP